MIRYVRDCKGPPPSLNGTRKVGQTQTPTCMTDLRIFLPVTSVSSAPGRPGPSPVEGTVSLNREISEGVENQGTRKSSCVAGDLFSI